MAPSWTEATSGGAASLSSDILSTALRPIAWGRVLSFGRPSSEAFSMRSSSRRASESSMSLLLKEVTVGEQRGRAARMDEDDILILRPAPALHQRDQPRQPLARIDRVEHQPLEPRAEPDR